MNQEFDVNQFVPLEEQLFLSAEIEQPYFVIAIGILASCRDQNLSLDEIRGLYQEHGTEKLNAAEVFNILIAIDRLMSLGYADKTEIPSLDEFVNDPNMQL